MRNLPSEQRVFSRATSCPKHFSCQSKGRKACFRHLATFATQPSEFPLLPSFRFKQNPLNLIRREVEHLERVAHHRLAHAQSFRKLAC